MALIIFWSKIAISRMLSLLKSSAFIIIWAMIIIGAFIYAIINKHFTITLETQTLLLAAPLLLIASLINSLKYHDTMPVLIKYSKSKYRNKIICIRYYLKHAFFNNILLIIFNIIACCSITNNSAINNFYLNLMFGITLLSIITSFLIMYFKNNYNNKIMIKQKTSRINPLIKIALYDYLTPDFLVLIMASAAFLIIVVTEFTKNINYFKDAENHSVFFIIMTIIFSVGFMGIIESVPKINWKFQAIISPNDINYHIKRTILLLGGIYGWLFILFIIFGSIINIMLLIKYLYCITVILLTTINIAFTIINKLVKFILLSFIAASIIWISSLSAVFLPVLIIPAVITFLKAKNEYREWSLL